MVSKLIQYNIPADDVGKTAAFYSKIFGNAEFARSLSSQVTAYHLPISVDGLQLTVTQRHAAQEPPIGYFSVDDLDGTIAMLVEAGGSVLVEPFNLPVAPEVLQKYSAEFRKNHVEAPADTVGRSAILRDPEGNLFGLTQLHEHAHWLFKTGRYQQPIDNEQNAQHARGLVLGKELKP